MSSFQEQLDLFIRNAPISPSEKQFRISEVRTYLAKVEAEITLQIDPTVLSLSTREGDSRTTIKLLSNPTVEVVSADSHTTIKPLSNATVEIVNSVSLPFRTLDSWSPVVLRNSEWKIWSGDDYKPHSVQAAQEIVKTLAKVQFFLKRDCVVDDINMMCPDIMRLAGDETAIRTLLRSHIANLRTRSRKCANKLWDTLKAKIDAGNRALDLWGRNTAYLLFGYYHN